MNVTRVEIARHVGECFAVPGGMSRQALVQAAVADSARLEVVDALQSLPDRTYTHLRDLWPHLRDLPVDHRG